MKFGHNYMLYPQQRENRNTIFPIGAALMVLAGVLSGCAGLVPSERQQSQSVKASEAIATQHELTIKRALDSWPEGPMKGLRVATGSNQVVSVDVPFREELEITSKAQQEAGSRENASGSLAVSIPFGVKVLLAAAGIAALVLALRMARNAVRGTAFGQALAMGDEVLRRQIQGWRSHAMTATDPKEIAEANAEIAELEAERGRLNAKR